MTHYLGIANDLACGEKNGLDKYPEYSCLALDGRFLSSKTLYS